MSVHSRALTFILLCACAQKPPVVAPVPEPARVGREAIAAVSGTGSGSGLAPSDPRALYESCRDRVEGTEADHECAVDSDCVKTGCSSELCIAKSVAEGVMSTCEMRTCFQVLESCTCQEGHCRWVVGIGKAPTEGGLDAGSLDAQ
jgi:eight-cysteine-cluster-containing protein